MLASTGTQYSTGILASTQYSTGILASTQTVYRVPASTQHRAHSSAITFSDVVQVQLQPLHVCIVLGYLFSTGAHNFMVHIPHNSSSCTTQNIKSLYTLRKQPRTLRASPHGVKGHWARGHYRSTQTAPALCIPFPTSRSLEHRVSTQIA